MAHGGKRPGAGRPKGSVGELARRASQHAHRLGIKGITPLEVLVNVMRALYAMAVNETGKIVDMELAKEAGHFATAAAPYMHPRLTAIEARIEGETRHAVVSDKVLDVEEWEKAHANLDPVQIPRLEGESKREEINEETRR